MLMPLDGVRVIDLTQYAAGPFCTRLLTDYGADVVKIERPGTGDPARGIPPFYEDVPGLERSGFFLFLNTGKRSVTLDLKTERGKELFRDLIRSADVLVESFSPRVMPSLDLDYETLSAINPRLIMTSISNFGQSGPYADWKGSELTLYGMGGPMLNTGHPDREPLKIAGHTTAFQVGATAAAATSIALWGAETSGEGDHLDVNFFETFMGLIDRRTTSLLNYQYTGDVSVRTSMAFSPGSGVWPTADGGFFFTTVLANRFPAMARMIGAENLLDNPDWATPAARSIPDRIDEFSALVIVWMLERTKREIRDAVEKAGVYGGPINTIAELLEDDHFRARGFFQQIDHPTTGSLTYPGYGFRLTTGDVDELVPPRRRAPLLGEHTDEILQKDLNLSEAEIARLRSQGVL